MFGFLLHLRHDLDCGGTCSDHRNGFVGVVGGCVPVGAVEEFTLEVVEAGYLWPFPIVQESCAVYCCAYVSIGFLVGVR